MRILISLMYYRPHYSGLTIYTERLARALASRGHQVTVLTSRFESDLAPEEVKDGVRIVRPKVWMRVSKGVIMPSMPVWAWKLIREADVVNAHAPQPDAAVIMMVGRFLSKPSVLTYHCDLRLPEGIVHRIANQFSHLTNHLSARFSDAIVTNTLDYAENSPFLSNYLNKVHAIPPPISLATVTEKDILAFREKNNILPGQRVIGMAARLATEKGVEYLVQAMPKVLEKYPNVRVLFAGQHQGVLGEEAYAQRLAPLIEQLHNHWSFLGVLPPVEWAVFFHESQVTVLPSINPTESFGMVQVESMTCGTPVVSTDLPGVRQPVLKTKMGAIVPPMDSEALADALISILDHPNGYYKDSEEIAREFAPATIAQEYEELFDKLLREKQR